MDYLVGHGVIAGPNSVQVKLNDGGVETVQTKNILIATGSEPSPLPMRRPAFIIPLVFENG